MFFRMFFTVFLWAFTAYAEDCVKPADNKRSIYFMGTGFGKSEEAARKKADEDAINQAHQIFGIIVSSRFSSYETSNTDKSVDVSEQEMRSLNDVRLKNFSKLCEQSVHCQKKQCRAKVVYRYSRKEYEIEKKRLKENEAAFKEKKRQMVTFGEKTETSKRFSFIFNDTKKGLPPSEIKDVDFKLNGKKYAIAPITHFYLEPNEYDVEIDHPRYDAIYSDTITVTPDSKQMDSTVIKWKKASACLKVSSNPGGAVLYIDGIRIKKTPLWKCFPVVPGKHTLKLKHPDYADYNTNFEIQKGEKKSLDYDLSYTSTFLNLRVFPKDAYVYLDGKRLKKKAPFKKYPITPDQIKTKKIHTFTVAKEGYKDAIFKLDLKLNGKYDKEIHLKPFQKNKDGVLKPENDFVFIPPSSNEKANFLINVLDSSVSYNRETKKMWAIVRINPFKYKALADKWEKKAKTRVSFPIQCGLNKKGCKIDKEELKRTYNETFVYARASSFDYGFFKDSASFLKMKNTDVNLQNKKESFLSDDYYLVIHTGNKCVQKFDFSVNYMQNAQGRPILNFSLSHPKNKAEGKENLFFAVTKCSYAPPMYLKLGRNV